MKEYKGEIKLIIIALIIFNVVFFTISVRSHKNTLDKKLKKVINLIDVSLPKELHDDLIDGEDLDINNIKSIFWQLSLYANSENLKFCYTIIDTPSGMKYAFGGIPLEVFEEGNYLDYYLYEVTSENDTICDLKKNLLQGELSSFIGVYEDDFGKYKSMILPFKTPKGNTILIGADYDYSEYQKGIFSEVITVLIVNSLILICTLLIIFSIYQKNEKFKDDAIKVGMTDHLTGLYTRKGIDLIEKRISSIPPTLWGILYFDLDGLKKVNDTKGHKEGDRYISTFANILKTVFRKEDLLIRLGGDEFLVVAELVSRSNAPLIENRINEHAKKDSVEFSMGFLFLETQDIKNINEVIKQADRNMYIHKQQKKSKRPMKK